MRHHPRRLAAASTVVLLERLDEDDASAAFARIDEIYSQEGGASPTVEVVERLADDHDFV